MRIRLADPKLFHACRRTEGVILISAENAHITGAEKLLLLLLVGWYWVPRYLLVPGTAATLAYCTTPDDRWGWFLEQLVEWKLAGETEVLGENLPQRHFWYTWHSLVASTLTWWNWRISSLIKWSSSTTGNSVSRLALFLYFIYLIN
jgi:hypothetical protein